ncbi:hypothetical protein FA95DRAFT_1567974 [Auriscalpium vulgare]|uniref:Uncharacterized protein n=1 Tax=Auriscalpium vulgare TaxID=40419 RepID=A0ACB8R1E2_9AGAM|nr:hypothetical protein FA95DRAFT_1567974 [Auriscalpium vulgare]
MPPPALPFDIYARVIEFIYILSQTQNIDYPTLSACALVCKDWAAPAQRFLFRRIIHPSDTNADADRWLQRAAPLLLRAFASRPHLGTYVRSLAIHGLPNRSIALLSYCPHIDLLHLVDGANPRVWLHILRAFGQCPSVLVASTPADGDVVDAARPGVRHLVREDFEDRGGDLGALSVSNAGTILNMTSVHRGGASYLRGLTTDEVPPDALLKKLTALESLIVGTLPSTSSRFTLPRTLLHFGFHEDSPYPRHMWVTKAPCIGRLAAALSELPDLRLVSVTGCAARGVAFLEYDNIDAFPRARYVD